ncbi:Ras-specific guanine nucleotide-releasing factor 2 [Collichthys lucidus]|uniref:Ras-specific guanine nucleotide-releasing factor 2 n=1 Tax=Collichthys lucidus TaxID=240159 RepID=A0A4U5UX37_COLLU|nr:Ras-specific guanine nucleotide-releasing factor 2 [Collichthys lucidus]
MAKEEQMFLIVIVFAKLFLKPCSKDIVSLHTAKAGGQVFGQLDFKLIVEPSDSPSFTVVLLAPSRQEKAAWTSDISQCIDNIRCNGLMTSVFEENSKVTVPHMINKTLNSCKVPQIRYASVERLLERLTDLRFLSIDFLNTFLHTYRIFTTATVVMDKLADIYKKPFSSIPIRSYNAITHKYAFTNTEKRSLELFFATNQNNRGGEHVNDKSPRLCRKFSSPPPLSIPSRTSSPVRTRKLSLHSPITARVGGLDLTSPLSNSGVIHNTSQSAASSPTSAHTPLTPTPQTPTPTTPPSSTSPPPNNSKPPQDQVPPIPSSLDQSPCSTAEGEEVPKIDPFCGKLRRSIRRAVLESVSLEKIIPESPQSSEAGDMSPCRSPSTPRHLRYRQPGVFTNSERTCDKDFIIRRAATNRVLNVLRHWVSKHSQDFEMNGELKMSVICLLEEVLRDPDLLPQERKATANILSALSQDEQDDAQLRIEDILQMMSNLVASQIMTHTDVGSRANSIEKWVAVADICRCLNNYNGVLEITSALNRSAIYRLKKTWAKISKQISHIIREIRQFQQTPYRIEHQAKVTQYLMDKTLIMDEDTLYDLSLKIEPRLPA